LKKLSAENIQIVMAQFFLSAHSSTNCIQYSSSFPCFYISIFIPKGREENQVEMRHRWQLKNRPQNSMILPLLM
jgi:hypothetical protein